jgi:hypothetical protein
MENKQIPLPQYVTTAELLLYIIVSINICEGLKFLTVVRTQLQNPAQHCKIYMNWS